MARGDNNKARAAQHEARILELLAEQPRTLTQLAQETGLSLDSLYLYRNKLVAAPKRIYVCGHEATPARPAPVYAVGDLPDAVFVAVKKPKLPEDRKDKARRLLLELLQEDVQTAEQAGIRLNLSTSRARFYISELREQGKAYIKRWQHPGHRGDLAPVYALGNKKDAPKPRETRASRYQREKSNPDKFDRIRAQRRKREAIQKATSKPQTWLSALGL